ncbi:MAG: histidyl-tRNA synthetase HisS [Parcubacteria group bacterium Greene0714_36]|nr:MAG: histidyl-tRNA synthetase HisS [Parcubacteria group bacterium Greene0714_36]
MDRLIAGLERLDIKSSATARSPGALIFNLIPNTETEYLAMAQEVRDAGIACSIYLGDDISFQAQLAYALKKEMRYVIIRGEEERKKGTVSVKNTSTREQKEMPREQLRGYFQT